MNHEEQTFKVSRPTLDPPLEKMSRRAEDEHYRSKQLSLFPQKTAQPDLLKEVCSGISVTLFSLTQDARAEVTTTLGELAERYYHRPPHELGSRERRVVVEELAKLVLVPIPRMRRVVKSTGKGFSVYQELTFRIPIPNLTFRLLEGKPRVIELSTDRTLADQVDELVLHSSDGWAKTEISFQWNAEIFKDLRADLLQVDTKKAPSAGDGAGEAIYQKEGVWHSRKDGRVLYDSLGYVRMTSKALEIEARLRGKRDSTAVSLMRILATRTFPMPELKVAVLVKKLRLDPSRPIRIRQAIQRAIRSLKAEGVLAEDSPEEPISPPNLDRRRGAYYSFKVNRGIWVKEGKRPKEGKAHPYPPETTADQLFPILKKAPTGSELREARDRLGLSLRSAGQRLGVPFSFLSLIERDKKPLPMRAVEEAWRMVEEGKGAGMTDQVSANPSVDIGA